MGAILIGDRCHLKTDHSRIFRVTGIIPENLSSNEMAQLMEEVEGEKEPAIAYWYTA